MNHWLCASCRATHRDSILRFDVTEKDLRRVLRALLCRDHRIWAYAYANGLLRHL